MPEFSSNSAAVWEVLMSVASYKLQIIINFAPVFITENTEAIAKFRNPNKSLNKLAQLDRTQLLHFPNSLVFTVEYKYVPEDI